MYKKNVSLREVNIFYERKKRKKKKKGFVEFLYYKAPLTLCVFPTSEEKKKKKNLSFTMSCSPIE
jgi:hypothetical protein